MIGPGVDWWALGVITFEFLTGYPPFSASTPMMIFQNILSRDVMWPMIIEMSMDAFDLIERLLNLEPERRLGANGM